MREPLVEDGTIAAQLVEVSRLEQVRGVSGKSSNRSSGRSSSRSSDRRSDRRSDSNGRRSSL